MQGASHPPLFPLLVQGIRQGQGVGVHFDDGAELRAIAVNLLDPLQVHFGNGAGGVLAALHFGLQVGDGGFVQGKISRESGGRLPSLPGSLPGAGGDREGGEGEAGQRADL